MTYEPEKKPIRGWLLVFLGYQIVIFVSGVAGVVVSSRLFLDFDSQFWFDPVPFFRPLVLLAFLSSLGIIIAVPLGFRFTFRRVVRAVAFWRAFLLFLSACALIDWALTLAMLPSLRDFLPYVEREDLRRSATAALAGAFGRHHRVVVLLG